MTKCCDKWLLNIFFMTHIGQGHVFWNNLYSAYINTSDTMTSITIDKTRLIYGEPTTKGQKIMLLDLYCFTLE